MSPRSERAKTLYRFICTVEKDKSCADKMLLEHPGIIEWRDSCGETAMHYLYIENDYDSVAYLLSCGADPNSLNDFGETMLADSGDWIDIRLPALLLKHGADPNLARDSGELPLYNAVSSGQKELVDLLLKHGADPHKENSIGESSYDALKLNESLSPGDRAAIKSLLDSYPKQE